MTRILRPGHNCMGIYEVKECGILVDAAIYYRAFYHAAMQAKKSIYLAGWLFDTSVRLLRGLEAGDAEGPVELLPFLNWLLERNPELDIRILAWDFNLIYSPDREWFQKWRFQWQSDGKIKFLFDDIHPVGASHHQKMAIIDNTVAFVGGLDICSERWDERSHPTNSELRRHSDGSRYEAFHDIQTYLKGPVALEIAGLFRERWQRIEQDGFSLSEPVTWHHPAPEDMLGLSCTKVALCRTQGTVVAPPVPSVTEIRRLFVDMINQARQCIYLENQYFSSEAVYRALLHRLQNADPSLNIVLILPGSLHSMVEQVAMGVAQAKIFHSLREAARQNGHSLGAYYRTTAPPGDNASNVYIHSKIMIVDDAILTVGSANTSNRSMGLDTELNVTWEASEGSSDKLRDEIKKVRSNLLSEHTGKDEQVFDDPSRLVSTLDTITGDKATVLHRVNSESLLDEFPVLRKFSVEDVSFDPERPVIEETLYEKFSSYDENLFRKSITALKSLWKKTRHEIGKHIDGSE